MNIFLYGKMIIFFLLTGYCVTASFAKHYVEMPLTWTPPKLENPLRISLSAGSGPMDYALSRDSGKKFVFTASMDKPITIRLKDDQDAVISLPVGQLLSVPGILVDGGRNVRMIGGSLKAIAPASQNLRAVLRFAGQNGSVFVEGLVIDANRQYGLDGFLVGSVRHKPGIKADIYLQNTLIKGIDSTREGFHADAFQYYGSTKTTRMDRVSVVSSYQGLFLDPQAEIDAIDLRNIDMRYADPQKGNGYIFFLRHENNKRHPAVTFENVYVAERLNMRPWQEFSVYPPASRGNGTVMNGNTASFPHFPEVKGNVIKGYPPRGSFVTENDAGLNYRSPGYATR